MSFGLPSCPTAKIHSTYFGHTDADDKIIIS